MFTAEVKRVSAGKAVPVTQRNGDAIGLQFFQSRGEAGQVFVIRQQDGVAYVP